MYRSQTENILVSVEPSFLADESDPFSGRYVWAYTIEIVNQGDQVVQLKTRHWVITDARGMTEHVDGPGVVGEQPILHKGERFRYTSGVPLKTPSGIMYGHYKMHTRAGDVIEVEIPAFSLDSPHQAKNIN